MKFSVVIVNYNIKYYLEQCLCSLYRAIDNLSAEIFVVDNASVDDSEAYLTERFPRITYIYNKENVGFAPAIPYQDSATARILPSLDEWPGY